MKRYIRFLLYRYYNSAFYYIQIRIRNRQNAENLTTDLDPGPLD